jgi:hypothetical protein
MSGYIVIFMLIDVLVFLSGGIDRINMDGSLGKVPQLMQEPVVHLPCNFVSFLKGKFRT